MGSWIDSDGEVVGGRNLAAVEARYGYVQRRMFIQSLHFSDTLGTCVFGAPLRAFAGPWWRSQSQLQVPLLKCLPRATGMKEADWVGR